MDHTENVHQILSKLGKNVIEILTMIRQSFREESKSHTRVLVWKNPNSLRMKKARQTKSKVKGMLIIFSDIKGTVHKKIYPGRPNSQFHILL
jgi:nitrogen fixation/metabolism regulation signal transduction histidine kinase